MAVLKSKKSINEIEEVGCHPCGKNLYLQVSKQGTKSWTFRFTSPVTKKRREMGLGSLDLVSLEAAQKLAKQNRRIILNGKDPIEERKKYKTDLRMRSYLGYLGRKINSDTPLDDEERVFLVQSLRRVIAGENANDVFQLIEEKVQ